MLDEASVEQFKTGLRGELIQPDDPGYDEACKVYNGMIDKRPRMIAHCSDVADVIARVNFARENEVLLAVRGGAVGLDLGDRYSYLCLLDTATGRVVEEGRISTNPKAFEGRFSGIRFPLLSTSLPRGASFLLKNLVFVL